MQSSDLQTYPSLRVAVLAGGNSAEREVSLRSGAAVAAALAQAGHQATRLDPARQPLATVCWEDFDACFIALHGGAGEDGRVQQQLEELGVPYTGSSPQASRLAMSKSASKARFLECDVPTANYLRIESRDSLDAIAERVATLGYPLVVKPDAQGSSLGLTVAEIPYDLPAAVGEALRLDRVAIVEPFLRGREFTVAVLDEQPLPLLEIVSPQRIFSYEAKYHGAQTQYHFEFQLPDKQRDALVAAALAAARALGTWGLVRVDLILDENGQPWVLEVNTIPGMTPRSLAPLAARRAGLEMPALCEHLVRRCLVPVEAS